MSFVKGIEINGDSNVWSTAGSSKKASDLMMILALNETMDQLPMADSGY